MKKKEKIYPLLLMIVLCSFIGFLTENVFKMFKAGYVDNRYMFLPFLLGYGIFTVALYILVGTPSRFFPLAKKEIRIRKPYNYLVYFIICTLLVSLGELALGYAVELVGGFRYWDYTNLPLNFTPYTSLFTSLGFGFIITLFMSVCFDPFYRLFTRLTERRAWRIVSVTLAIVLLGDMIASFVVMFTKGKKKLLLWRIYMPWRR